MPVQPAFPLHRQASHRPTWPRRTDRWDGYVSMVRCTLGTMLWKVNDLPLEGGQAGDVVGPQRPNAWPLLKSGIGGTGRRPQRLRHQRSRSSSGLSSSTRSPFAHSTKNWRSETIDAWSARTCADGRSERRSGIGGCDDAGFRCRLMSIVPDGRAHQSCAADTWHRWP